MGRQVTIVFIGMADPSGGTALNLALSKKRATLAAEFFRRSLCESTPRGSPLKIQAFPVGIGEVGVDARGTPYQVESTSTVENCPA